LTPNMRYVITIQELKSPLPSGDAWDVLEAMVGTVEAQPDWSTDILHHSSGSPKSALK
jgi:hypothetical protein